MNNKKIIELTTDEITAISGGFKLSEECKAYIGYAVGVVSLVLVACFWIYGYRAVDEGMREYGEMLRENHEYNQRREERYIGALLNQNNKEKDN
jgi:hypothetical protein